MRRVSPFLLLVLCLLAAAPAARCQSPVARDGNSVIAGQARFQVLSPTLVRMELAPDGRFVDSPSAVVVKRDWPLCEFDVADRDGRLTIDTGRLRLEYRMNSDRFEENTLSVTWGNGSSWHPDQTDSRNLGGTVRSLDGVGAGNRPLLGEGVLSRNGYYLFDDSNTPVINESTGWIEPRNRPDAKDLYLFVYGPDYKHAMQEYARLFGDVPMIPRWALGSWYSRYWQYHDWELKDVVTEYRERGIPLDVLVIDVDWHTNGWEGYDWNSEYFPDPLGFLKWCSDQGLQVTLNNHPGVLLEESRTPEVRKRLDLGADERIRFNLATKLDADVYMDVLHSPLIDDGVDFWWIDGESAQMDGLNGQFWTNRVYYDGTEDHTKKRSLIFSRWGGVGSHRYPMGFSGDTFACWEVLQYEVGMTQTAGHHLWQWSHDIGGFNGDLIEDQLYLRWVQFGVFSPALRLHSNHGRRLPWDYGEEIAALTRDAFALRYRLIPYIYTLFRDLHDTAVSPCRALYVEHPTLQEAYEFPYEYYFGPDMLVAPATQRTADGFTNVQVYLPPGLWHDFFTGRIYEGDKTIVYPCPLDRIPVFARAGAIVPMQPDMQYVGERPVDPLTINLYRGADGEFALYEDDGVSLGYRKGEFTRQVLRLTESADGFRFELLPAEGNYTGMVERRNVLLRVYGATKPDHVFVGRTELAEGQDWRVDPETSVLEIGLGPRSVREGQVVTVVNPGGFERYRWLRDAVAIFERIIAMEDAEDYEPFAKLAMRLEDDIDAVSAGGRIPYDLGPVLSQAAAAVLDTTDTKKAHDVVARVLGFELSAELRNAPEFSQADCIAAAASWDPVLADGPQVSIAAPADWGVTQLAGVAESYARYSVPTPGGESFVQTSVDIRAHAQVGRSTLALTHSFPWAHCSVTKWSILGPFDNKDDAGLTTDYGPESGVDLSATYAGVDGETRWEEAPKEIIQGTMLAPRYIDLRARWRKEQVCAYATTRLYSDADRDVMFDIGSDDQVAIWLNGEEIFRFDEPRPAEPSQNQIPVTLTKGVNEVLVKVCQAGGQWGFYFEVKTPEGGVPSGIEVR